MVMINKKFLKYQKLGEKVAEKICLGWKVTTILNDNMGNGVFLFEHDEFCTTYVPFTELNVNDEVTLTYNGLSEIVRDY